MKLSAGQTLYGFTVDRVRYSEELGGAMVELSHDQTGCQVCWVDSGETNKAFTIAFKTLPENSTGVFHILEHSVLCGSEKYPVREPFVELLKSSMNTFLNAMTGSDHTMYPVSSRNEQDFLNLASVYMDAVFAPRILTEPNIFYQEGHHIEQNDGVLSYKGVVYNEMKGAMSDGERLGEQKLVSMIFRDNSYGFNSGGDPEVIPELTYEQFVATYKRFYHPSNARVFLDGNVPVEKTLALLDEYFSRFDRAETLPEVVMQAPVGGEETICYEAAEGDSLEDKDILMMGRIIGTWQDRAQILAAQALTDALAGSNEAPLKRAVLASGLAQNITLYVDESIAQPAVEIIVKGVKAGMGEEVKRLIRETAEALVRDGLSRDAIEASINRLEFRAREPEEPKGLRRMVEAFTTWLFGGDPMTYFMRDEQFAQVRAMLENGGFEALLQEMLVNDEGLNVLYMKPSLTIGEETRAREAAKLKAIADSWTEKDWAENKALNEALAKWQQTEDSPEDIKKLPMLTLDQVSAEVEYMPTEESAVEGVKVLYHPASCRGIAHMNLSFKLTDCTKEELTKLQLLPMLLSRLSTAKHGALELQQMVKNDLGRLDFALEVKAKKNEADLCTPYLVVKCSALESKLDRAAAIIAEILTETDFDQKDKIREFALQQELRAVQTASMYGHAFAISVAYSHETAKAAVEEALSGLTAIQGIHDLARNFDANADEVIALYQRVAAESVCRARLTVSVTAAKSMDVRALILALPEGTPVPESAKYVSTLPMRVGVRIPAQVSFAIQASSLNRLGYQNNGAYMVAQNILSLSYLWNQVRVQGGAYGTGLSVGKNGRIVTYSFRDPTPARSLKVNEGMPEYLESFCAGDEALDKYIISTVAETEPLISARVKGAMADDNWFAGYTKADEEALRQEILSADRKALLSFRDIARDFAEKGAVCVVGFADALNEVGDLTIYDI